MKSLDDKTGNLPGILTEHDSDWLQPDNSGDDNQYNLCQEYRNGSDFLTCDIEYNQHFDEDQPMGNDFSGGFQ